MKSAQHPFQFFTVSYLTRVGNQTGLNLSGLLDGLEKCNEATIFHHTFQSLSKHHFLREGFSNDFAQWALAACNRADLAETLAGLDIRDYLSLGDLRNDLRRIVADYCAAHPQYAAQIAFEPFYFCEDIEVTVPLGVEAGTLEEFRQGIEKLTHASLYFHFISSRLRLHLRTNDFSVWLSTALGMDALAQRLNSIDIYTNTLDGVRTRLLDLIHQEMTR
ncbi:MAG TPA: DUF5752 family protein [Terriglobia bacterium]|nr:DUF5752 family protein [Terriglobia bacterium]